MSSPTAEPLAPLTAAQRSRIRRLSAPAGGAEGEGGEVNVVPYLDILMNILMFMLATISVVFVASVDTTAAPINGRITPITPTLRMTVLITDQGYSVKTADGNLATGCDSLGAGLSVLLGPLFPMRVDIPRLAFVSLPVLAVGIGLLASVAGLRRAVTVDPALAFGGP